ncbi:MAG: glycosyltransferase family 2 protein [Candidatus Methanomethyliaceae archaeon]|nr:glycosyltransferase family 2 protein [Candidatus Methanomethyliaceae archaeon]
MRISTIIPTYNRPKALERCLKSILKQTLLPAEVIVVESGPFNVAKEVVNRYKEKFGQLAIELKYFRNLEGSLTIAKELGIQNASFEIVSFLDDDMIIHKDYYKAIMEVYERVPYTLGVMGKNVEKMGKRKILSKLVEAYQKIFLIRINHDFRFRLLPSMGNTYSDREGIVECEWLSGASTFKKDILLKVRPDSNLKKYCWNEDLDLSYRIYKKFPGTLFFTSKAKYLHKNVQLIRSVNKELLFMSEVYDLYLFYKNFDHSLKNGIIYLWSRLGRLFLLFGLFVINGEISQIPNIVLAPFYCLKNIRFIINQNLTFFNDKLGRCS